MTKKKITPKEIVAELDKYIIGQNEAKKAVAIAIFNRHRRLLLDHEWQEAISPKNLMMIGPTGVGKTEIARRLAKLISAPFIKVEATKFTEVGYVGRDVESMVRDLAEIALSMETKKRRKDVREEAEKEAEKRLVKILVPGKDTEDNNHSNPMMNAMNSLGSIFGTNQTVNPNPEQNNKQENDQKILDERLKISEDLRQGKLEDKMVTIKLKDNSSNNSMFDNMGSMGVDMSETMGQLLPPKYVERKMTVKAAREALILEESDKLIDQSDINEAAIRSVENSGIIFIDEFDKITSGRNRNGGEVSREGVQRDILPIVEGSQVKTKYGMVNTEHILFIASGAFEQSKPSDLIAELQGRFPIRVELNNLSESDFKHILVDPDDALIKQYIELIKTDGVNLKFSDEAIDKIAQIAARLNEVNENIGARRLATVIEKLLEDILFESPGMQVGEIEITKDYVEQKLSNIVEDRDLSEYIL